MDKIIVVTGGTRGIGRSIIEKFAREGFNIVTCARKDEELKLLKNTIENEYGKVKIFTRRSDLSIREEVEDFGSYVNSLNYDIDVLVNNTGVFIPGEIIEEDDGVLEKMINTNLYSAYHLTRSLVKNMIKRRSGHIFNICSIASITAYATGGSYSITKYALYGMSKSLREELKPYGIRVTSVLPGATLTSSWDGVDLPPERFIKPEDVAEAVFAAWRLSGQTVVEDLVLRPQLGDI